MFAKGLIAPVFLYRSRSSLFAAHRPMAPLARTKPITGTLLFLLIAAPWHILCGIYNPDQGNPSATTPPWAMSTASSTSTSSTNTFCASLASAIRTRLQQKCQAPCIGRRTWSGSSPWSMFLPAAFFAAWKTRRNWMKHLQRDAGQTVDFYIDNAVREDVATYVARLKFRVPHHLAAKPCFPRGR